MKKEIVFAICAKEKTIKGLKSRQVPCVLCEELCWYSGFGNVSLKDFSEGEHINLEEKFIVKKICRDCSLSFYHTEIKVMVDMAKMQDKRQFLKEVESMINQNKHGGKNEDTKTE